MTPPPYIRTFLQDDAKKRFFQNFGATTQQEDHQRDKIFSENDPLIGVKTCGKFEFDIFEAKKRFPDSGKACVLKRKVAKTHFYDFSLQYTGP